MASKFCKVKFPNEEQSEIDVEILWWGEQLVYERDFQDKIINTISVTVVFCRDIKTGAVIAIDPEQLQFKPEETTS